MPISSSRGFYAWLSPCLTILLTLDLLCHPPPCKAQEDDSAPVDATFAILIGNEAYAGADASFPRLQYTDDDVLRWSQFLSPLVSRAHQTLLLQPDALVEQALTAQKLAYSAPTFHNFEAAITKTAEDIRTLKKAHPKAHIQLVLTFSSHGTKAGLHLEDRELSSEELHSQLARLRADHILVIADACFSDKVIKIEVSEDRESNANSKRRDRQRRQKQWQKETQPVMDTVSEPTQDLSNVATIASVTPTLEIPGIHNGLLTHMLTSGLQGPADLDGDGRILYAELKTYLRHYTKDTFLLANFRVRPPAQALALPSALLPLQKQFDTGLVFTRRPTSEGVLCYVVKYNSMRMASEFCREAKHETILHLPPGVYDVREQKIQADGSDQVSKSIAGGKVETVSVGAGLTSVGANTLTRKWYDRSVLYRAINIESLPAEQSLSDEESAYLRVTPYRRAIGWKQSPDRYQLRLRVSLGVPLGSSTSELMPRLTTGQTVTATDHREMPTDWSVESLTQERPELLLSGVLDQRFIRLKGRYLYSGLELGMGISPMNAVDACVDVPVMVGQYGIRLGLELPGVHVQQRVGAVAGGITGVARCNSALSSNRPSGISERQTTQAAVLEQSGTVQYDTTAPQLGLEWGLAWHASPQKQWEISLSPRASWELQKHGEDILGVPYFSILTSVGMRWY